MNIPTIIKQQLLGTNTNIVWSWGAHGWAAITQNTLAFKVDGHHFKGIVCITLDESQDLYDIYFFDNRSISGLVKNKKPSKQFQPITGVFCDQLVKLIDDNIERIDAYSH